MKTLLVFDSPDSWPTSIHDVARSSEVEVVTAQAYLTEPRFAAARRLRVLNLCRSYRYQSQGYYVSLLAAARGHHPQPSIQTIQDLKNRALVRAVPDDLDRLIQTSLKRLASERFELSIYFGRNVAKTYDRLARQIHNLFPAPFLRTTFRRIEDNWELTGLRLIGAHEVPEHHRGFVVEAARDHLTKRQRAPRPRPAPRFSLAILVEPKEQEKPSDEQALRRLRRVADAMDLETELIEVDDFSRLTSFDALFIRVTTGVNHYTYRFSRYAASEGMVVVDDPQSIIRCTNKVFLAELLRRHKIPCPPTLIVHRDNVETIKEVLGLPCILKLPDSAFSLGVKRFDDEEALRAGAERFLEASDLVIAQAYRPTDFDWRVGILDRKPLYVCRYHMARGHWQIAQYGKARPSYGSVDTIPVDEAPSEVVRTALDAANLIGDGLYGVDIKQVDGTPLVIEVNDNPNLDGGSEDGVLGDGLYRRLLEYFVERLERRIGGAVSAGPQRAGAEAPARGNGARAAGQASRPENG
ncbi:MAG: RimK family alpha-L-glutamate ligase [Acidobacteria bacterium]|nr:MAG: RimK family alpha-L-glutamate ligase [Acidobacteriota bacterium]REK10566.1 MAG: RimK family alpha-L-glutamate ligase [Acidobacteriota bacterium]